MSTTVLLFQAHRTSPFLGKEVLQQHDGLKCIWYGSCDICGRDHCIWFISFVH